MHQVGGGELPGDWDRGRRVKGWLLVGTTVAPKLVCEGEEGLLYKGMGEALMSCRKSGEVKCWARNRQLRVSGQEGA